MLQQSWWHYIACRLATAQAGGYSTFHMPEPQAGSRPSPLVDPFPLAGKRALVVGGSGGIGRAVCRSLAARGAAVVVHGGSSRERLDRVLAELRALGTSARAEVDGFLLRLEHPSDLLDKLGDLGTIDILALAFGPFVQKPLADTSASDWERLALLDLALPGAICSALLPAMIGRKWGRILLFGGTRTDAIRAYASNAAYAAAKTGLAVLAKSLAVEGAGANVACLLVCPGLVDTEYLGDAARSALRKKAPGGRLLEPETIAEIAIGLLAMNPCAVSGGILNMDGGLSF